MLTNIPSGITRQKKLNLPFEDFRDEVSPDFDHFRDLNISYGYNDQLGAGLGFACFENDVNNNLAVPMDVRETRHQIRDLQQVQKQQLRTTTLSQERLKQSRPITL